MKKKMVFATILAVIISIAFTFHLFADDVEIELSTNDGSTAVVIKNAAGVKVARIDSKGKFITQSNSLLPPGALMAFATETAPSGWLQCNGAAVSRTQYAELFDAIGTMYGSGDGSTTFNLPDYRGLFLRGWDNGAGNDPNAATRSDRGDGTAGDAVGSKQEGQIQSHRHNQKMGAKTYPWAAPNLAYSYQYQSTAPLNGVTNYAGGSETRPKNINVLYCIRY